MTSELKAAAERIRRISAGETLFEVYGTAEWKIPNNDLWELADAFLAEHPADDDVAITEEWLLSVGFRWSLAAKDTLFIPPVFIGMRRHDSPVVLVDPGIDSKRHWQCDNATTRGDVRRLFAGLKLTLKESP